MSHEENVTSTTASQDQPAPGLAGALVAQSHCGFPIVGIGASAGGLAAFEAFFSGMPKDADGFGKLTADPGMAFVLVQHLDPNHKSILSEIIRRYTRLPVFEVEDGMVVQPNCIYVIPPGHDLALLNGALQLLEPTEPRGLRLPIDFFFRSLAREQRERAIGIVLSGTGSDGTQGVRAIKGEGGMVMAQNTASTEFDGMPRSAVATGLVDYELPPAEMPAQLVAYDAHAFGQLPKSTTLPAPKVENALKKIFILLRAQTGHDFSQYKPSTIHRRIERRMAVHQIEGIDGYVKYLQQTPAEVEALFRDMLIGVTHFFRDPEVFQVLEEQVIPALFAGKSPGAVIRVWTAGCSTGEEAYSIAILLVERIEAIKASFTVQLFATDIDSQAIATARAGRYPASIAADLSPERLARFFTAEADGGGYRIHKNIRDLLVFSEQDVIKDPPFSKLDLISCRNLLIYLGAELQKKLIPLFHFALKPDGWLFLGTSEGVGEHEALFRVLVRKAKIFQRKTELPGQSRVSFNRFASPSVVMDTTAQPNSPRSPSKSPDQAGQTLREMTERTLLAQVIAAGALVNAHGDILYLHGRTGLFLEPSPGEAGINNILKMAREGLRRELTITLHKAAATRETSASPGLRVKTNGHFTTVNLTIRPVTTGPGASTESPLFLVILEEVPEGRAISDPASVSPGQSAAAGVDVDARLVALRAELLAKEESLQSTIEELESSAEELKSSSEEMQSVNEELQSTNEELETSKEELQSVNEELATVNTELQTKVFDLSRANNDMNNLLAGTGIGTVFVDIQLRILRFTPAAGIIINLIPTDVGRPVAHVVTNLVGYTSLVADVKAVLDTLVPKEVEVRSLAGRHYTLRIQPYRTLDNVIEGAVITFLDVTELVESRESLRRLAVVVRDAHDAITVQDLAGRTLAWNAGAVRMYGWTEAEALKLNVRDRIPETLRDAALARLAQLSRAEVLEPYLTQRLTKSGESVEVSIVSTALVNEAGVMYAVATTERARTGATL